MSVILETRQLCKFYGAGENQVKAVNQVDIQIEQGEFVAIVGKSGSGTHLSVSHRPVFLLNSCLSLFSAAWFPRHPLSLSYGAILPSSLTMLLPPALGFSPHPPVSVYGTGTV